MSCPTVLSVRLEVRHGSEDLLGSPGNTHPGRSANRKGPGELAWRSHLQLISAGLVLGIQAVRRDTPQLPQEGARREPMAVVLPGAQSSPEQGCGG